MCFRFFHSLPVFVFLSCVLSGQPVNSGSTRSGSVPEKARDLFADNERGDDSASGLSGSPVRTLRRAVALLKAGDTLHLSANTSPWRETLRISDISGTPERPIVIDGHGAVITGCDATPVTDWSPVANSTGLYRNTRLIDQLVGSKDEPKLQRMFLVIDGTHQRMGRSSKGARPEFPPLSSLKPGEWTFVAAERAFYVRLDGPFVVGRIEAPLLLDGVAISSSKRGITDVVIKNIRVTRVLNDGFNIHGPSIRRVHFENISAEECGDDGFSQHEDSECSIEGYVGARNSTGIANANSSVLHAHKIRLEGNYGINLWLAHSIRADVVDAVIVSPTSTQPVALLNPQGMSVTFQNLRDERGRPVPIPSLPPASSARKKSSVQILDSGTGIPAVPTQK